MMDPIRVTGYNPVYHTIKFTTTKLDLEAFAKVLEEFLVFSHENHMLIYQVKIFKDRIRELSKEMNGESEIELSVYIGEIGAAMCAVSEYEQRPVKDDALLEKCLSFCRQLHDSCVAAGIVRGIPKKTINNTDLS